MSNLPATTNLSNAHAFGADLIRAGLAPHGAQNPHIIAMIVAQGAELGLSPMQSMRTIHSVKGRLCISAHLMRALVLKSGKAKYLRIVSSDESQATYETMRLEDPEPTRMTWSAEQAKRAGLATEVWRKYPAEMLRARCSAAICAAVYPDVLCGLQAEEELTHDDGIQAEVQPTVSAIVDGALVEPPARAGTEDDAATDAAAIGTYRLDEESQLSARAREAYHILGQDRYREVIAASGISGRPQGLDDLRRCVPALSAAVDLHSLMAECTSAGMDMVYDGPLPSALADIQARIRMLSADLADITGPAQEHHLDVAE